LLINGYAYLAVSLLDNGQEGVTSCNSGMAQEERLQEILDLRKLWTAEGSDRIQKDGYPLCKTQA
jgi:hypothetical protein